MKLASIVDKREALDDESFGHHVDQFRDAKDTMSIEFNAVGCDRRLKSP
jgi:hypothetical protein